MNREVQAVSYVARSPLVLEFRWCSNCKRTTTIVSNGEVACTIGSGACPHAEHIGGERLPLYKGRLAEVLRA